jgi:hypothetical protein
MLWKTAVIVLLTIQIALTVYTLLELIEQGSERQAEYRDVRALCER